MTRLKNAGFDYHTVADKVRFCFLFDCTKHSLEPDAEQFAADRVNEMTNSELLEKISEAIEDRIIEALYEEWLRNPTT